MRIDKNQLTEENINEPIQVSIDDAKDPDGLLAQKIEDDIKHNRPVPQKEPEYEYVELKDATDGFMGTLKNIVQEYFVVILCLALMLVSFIVVHLATNVNSILVAIGFGVAAAIAVVLLYFAWHDKKEAEAAYKHAVEVIEPVKAKLNNDRKDNAKDNK